MIYSLHNLPVFLISAALLFSSSVTSTPNSACADPGISLLRPCAAYCVGCEASRSDQIAYQIGCGDFPPNECWCRVDLFPLATAGLSSCVEKSCTAGGWVGDYSSAERFYTSYCQAAGFTAVMSGPVNTDVVTTVDQNTVSASGGGITTGE
jgi:hypothetical protein